MIETLSLTRQEVLALRRFRTSTDAKPIREVLNRMLGIAREDFETEQADEGKRLHVQATKRTIDVLFNAELILENRNGQE